MPYHGRGGRYERWRPRRRHGAHLLYQGIQNPNHLHLQRQVQPETQEFTKLHPGHVVFAAHKTADPEPDAENSGGRGNRHGSRGDGVPDRNHEQRHQVDNQPTADAEARTCWGFPKSVNTLFYL